MNYTIITKEQLNKILKLFQIFKLFKDKNGTMSEHIENMRCTTPLLESSEALNRSRPSIHSFVRGDCAARKRGREQTPEVTQKVLSNVLLFSGAEEESESHLSHVH